MKHSFLNKRKAFDLIASELEAHRQVTDQQIMDLCLFTNTEQARTLLADLADEGAISISWAGGKRLIALGPKERAKAAPAARPVPSVVRPNAKRVRSESEGVARIMSILRGDRSAQPTRDVVTRLRQPEAPKAQPDRSKCQPDEPAVSAPQSPSEVMLAIINETPERPEVETAETKGEGPEGALTPPLDAPSRTKAGELPAQAEEAGEQARGPQPQTVGARQQLRAVPKPCTGGRTHTVSIAVTRKDRARIVAAAEAQGLSMSRFISEAVEQVLDAAECDTGRKHRLSANVLRAWRSDPEQRTLDAFVTGLIELGLALHRDTAAYEQVQFAEAAE